MKAARAPEDAESQPRVGVGVLLLDEGGRVLLTLRRFPPEAECWSIIGGKVDFLETVEACAVREALEEVGLKIAIDRLLIWAEYWKAKREIASRTRPRKCAGSGWTNFLRTSR